LNVEWKYDRIFIRIVAECAIASSSTTLFYRRYAVERVTQRNTSKPFWLHLTHQAVHTGDHRTPPVWELWPGDLKKDYISSLYVLDNGIANLTQALKSAGMWENTIFFLTADNGGDCGLPAQNGKGGAPGFASNYPLLGRKCTAFDGGTRTAAFVAGGLVPVVMRGTVSTALIYITDWYATLSKLAGVDPTDDWTDENGTVSLMSGASMFLCHPFVQCVHLCVFWYEAVRGP
jgi:arylsulfatase A-like enzyme